VSDGGSERVGVAFEDRRVGDGVAFGGGSKRVQRSAALGTQRKAQLSKAQPPPQISMPRLAALDGRRRKDDCTLEIFLPSSRSTGFPVKQFPLV
jgi:hypothetical protein